MKRISSILGLAGFAVASLSAHAQVSYTDGDLILGFSRSGSSDFTVDIGQATQYQNQSPGSTITVGGYDKTAQLLFNFGNLNSIQFGVIGTQSASPIDFLTKSRTSPGTQNAAPGDYSLSTATQISSSINGIIGSDGFGGTTSTGIVPYSQGIPADPVANTATAVIIPTTGAAAVNSFTHSFNSTGGLKSQTTGVLNTAPASFTSPIVSDLFEYDHAGGNAKYLGDFALNTDGSVTFTAASPVPEPSTYGIMAGAGLLLVLMRKQLTPETR